MNKIIKYSFLITTLVALSNGCGESFLDQKPLGRLDEQYVVGNKEGVERLLIGAYALLDGFTNTVASDAYKVSATNWTFGSIAGGEAHKGSIASDQPPINEIEAYIVSPLNEYNNARFRSLYDGIFLSNQVINKLNDLPPNAVTDAEYNRILAEARALRGFYHFEAKKMWDDVPFVDEDTEPSEVTNVGDTDIWPLIEADFQFATNTLENSGMEVGRWNKWAAKAFLGKTQIYRKSFTAAEATLQDVYDNGVNQNGVSYILNPQFRQAFNGNNDNSAESVMAVQYTGNDGSGGLNASSGEVLNFPNGGGAVTGCCGFFQPSHEFVNSFRTNPSGLPFLDGSYNTPANEVTSDEIIVGGVVTHIPNASAYTQYAGSVDPRLDWTVGRRDVPFLDWGLHKLSWIRDPKNGGPFSSMKHVFNAADVGVYTDVSGWTAGFTTNNYYLMRFADVILLLAEAKIENDKLDDARTLINEVRQRAIDSPVPGSPANYVINLYTSAFASEDEARAAVRMERKLELGLEGHRFFDLVRWGIAAPELNAYIAYEKKWRSYMTNVVFTAGEDEYYPVPQRQMELSGGKIIQNSYHD